MAKKTDLQSLVTKFAAELEAAVTARVNDEFAARFDDFRSRILGGATGSTRALVAAGAKAAKSAKAPKASKAAKADRRGPKKGGKAVAKPCPVTGVLNTHRRFSYLMPEVRTPENLAKFKGAAKAKADAKPEAKAKAKAKPEAKAKRGPGRPKGSGKGRAKKAAAAPAPSEA
jgi:hypothetical protein